MLQLLYNSSWITSYYAPTTIYRFGYNTTRSDDNMIRNCNIRQNNGSGSNPHIITYMNFRIFMISEIRVRLQKFPHVIRSCY